MRIALNAFSFCPESPWFLCLLPAFSFNREVGVQPSLSSSATLSPFFRGFALPGSVDALLYSLEDWIRFLLIFHPAIHWPFSNASVLGLKRPYHFLQLKGKFLTHASFDSRRLLFSLLFLDCAV